MKERKFCSVCHQLGDGFHFEAIACKACAAFFRRITTMNLVDKYKCRKTNSCIIRMGTRDNCKSCRYAKCLNVGMNPDVVRMPQKKGSININDNNDIISSDSVPSTSISNPLSVCSTSCSSILNFEIDESSMPVISSVLEAYQTLCRKRFSIHDTRMEPKLCSHIEFCELYLRDIHLQNDFLENSFSEYKAMEFDEKKRVFKHFFVAFLILEMGFKTFLEGTGKNLLILANGDYIDVQQLDQYYMDPNNRWKCKPEDAVKLYQPSFDQMQRNVHTPVAHHKLTLVEFLALAALCTWNESVDGNPSSYYRNCQPMRQKIITDLVAYYQKDHTDTDPLLRLSSVLMLLPQLERSIQLFVEHVEVKSAFQCFALHDRLYEIISGV